MKVLIIGAGLMGITTAFLMRERGWDVQVIDRAEGAARETSFANGALLTPSMPQPWNSPGSWRVLLKSLVSTHAPLKLRLNAVPSLRRWGIQFLRNSNPARFEQNTLRNLRLALYSANCMKHFRDRVGAEQGYMARGTLRIFRDALALEQAVAVATHLAGEGVRFEALTTEQTLTREPGLVPIGNALKGSIHYFADEAGDAHQFCLGVARKAESMGVEFSFDTDVRSLEIARGRVVGVKTTRGPLRADQYVVAAGSYSSPLLQAAGIALPVQPAKGYSITVPHRPERLSLSIPILDDTLHAAVVPLGPSLRVAGTAEFAGYDRSVDPRRIENLFRLLRAVLPEFEFDPQDVRAWCGLRPMSADGVPLIGFTSVKDLLVNTGHGPLGWTLAAGSAFLLADLLTGAATALDPATYSLQRFGSVTAASV